MALKNMSIHKDPTVVVTPGASNFTLGSDGVSVQGGSHFVFKEDLDYETRRQVTVKHRPPTYDSKNQSYGKDKKSFCIAWPEVLVSGAVVFNTIRIERECHPSFAVADQAALLKMAVGLLVDTETDDFWATGDIL
jgi:hypothetical protein